MSLLIEASPPPYNFDEDLSSPMYSISAGSSERVIQYEPFRRTRCPEYDWIYETDHMTINMGSRVWGLHAPSYGLNGRIEGTTRFLGERSHVERVTATLEGYLITCVSQRGAKSGELRIPIISRTIPLYVSYMGSSFNWDEEQSFSIPIPAEVNVQGNLSQLPPSFYAYYHNLLCEITYCLKIRMTRKGLRRHELKIIPILYLPKTRPSEPPLPTIPRPSREFADLPTAVYERVKTVNLPPYQSSESKGAPSSSLNLDGFSKCVYFSLPSPQCFTAGEFIPFTLSLVFPDDPVLAKLLTRNIRIVLLKRLQLWRKGIHNPVTRDTAISSAQLRYMNEYSEGIMLLRGTIRAGAEGRENSWCIDGTAEVQYVLRVILHPPEYSRGHLPSFRHDEILQITTDYWGTLDRELTATGGTPTPALGLAGNLRHDY